MTGFPLFSFFFFLSLYPSLYPFTFSPPFHNFSNFQSLFLLFSPLLPLFSPSSPPFFPGLHVKYNQIRDISPELLLNMGGLEEMDFEGNRLSHVPPQMHALVTMKKLYLSRFFFFFFFSFFFSFLFFFLLLLSLLFSFLFSSLIPNICLLFKKTKNKQKTKLRNNISELPPEFGNLRCLEELYINDNNISTLAHIVNLTTLRVLNLSNNNLSELPREISRLSLLRVFYFFFFF